MNIYEKLQTMRCELQTEKLQKTGKNRGVGYGYFELQDFLPRVNELMLKHKVASNITFNGVATLTLTDIAKPEDKIAFTCPMSEASLKGCHPVQNLGAVITYIRRYLYINAFEIVEHDALDASQPVETPKKETTMPQNLTKQPLEGDKEAEARVEITKLLREMYGDDEAIKDGLEQASSFEGKNGLVKGKRSTFDLKGKWLLSTLGTVRKMHKEYTEFAIPEENYGEPV